MSEYFTTYLGARSINMHTVCYIILVFLLARHRERDDRRVHRSAE